MKRITLSMLVLLAGLLGVDSVQVQSKIRLNGFGDITLGRTFGRYANEASAEKFKQYGLDAFAKSTNVGFGLVGTDFVVTADLTDDLTYQGELNLQVERGGSGEIEVETERFYIDYAIKDWINVQAGIHHVSALPVLITGIAPNSLVSTPVRSRPFRDRLSNVCQSNTDRNRHPA